MAKNKVLSSATVTSQKRRFLMQQAYVEYLLDEEQISQEFVISLKRVQYYRRVDNWIALRKAYLKTHPINNDYMILIKNRERAEVYRIAREKIGEKIESLKTGDDKFYDKISKYLTAYERACKGERLEDGQTTVLKKGIAESNPEADESILITVQDTKEKEKSSLYENHVIR
jgi:hypothetical protein